MSVLAAHRRPLSRYRPPPRGLPPPLPPRWLPRERWWDPYTPLGRFVVLSVLLHALAILLFGAPAGGSREGRALWGALRVELAPGRAAEAPPPLRIERELSLPQRRAPAAAPAPPPPPPAPSRPQPEPLVFPPLLDRVAMPERRVELETFRVPPPAPTPAPPPPRATPLPQVAAPELRLAPRDSAAVELAPIPEVRRAPPEPARVAVPLVEAETLPTPARSTAHVERELVEAPTLWSPPAPPAAVPRPVEVEALPVPAPAVREEGAALEPLPAIEPLPAREALAAPRTLLPPREVVRAGEAPARDAAPAAPAAREAPSESPFRRGGAGRPAEPPPSDYDPTAAPHLDLDAMRRRAGELAREGTGNRALLPFPMPPLPERKTKLESAIEGARKPDCREAYKHFGLAAIVPLIANQFGEGSCRW